MAYATVSDLEAWLTPEPAPANAVRLLELASDRIDTALYGVAYDVDDPDVQAVLTKACVRQVHWAMETDDETGALSDVQSMSTGTRSQAKFARTKDSPSGPPKLCDAAVDVLRVAGLLQVRPLVVG
ncbi:hypothetical protein [Streptomyces sp. 4R-3d]|uniref:hypothetical protein n=1 Tax=Streptomyces sp. 4R-3d TaxID=2559605 RepID=UPI0010729502|nr:hypothetical protein [Streptomyces sp. 4R-3d]TFI30161.1 hypothetical protein E4P36_05275 [Streptomyces sp. 4R-3d]